MHIGHSGVIVKRMGARYNYQYTFQGLAWLHPTNVSKPHSKTRKRKTPLVKAHLKKQKKTDTAESSDEDMQVASEEEDKTGEMNADEVASEDKDKTGEMNADEVASEDKDKTGEMNADEVASENEDKTDEIKPDAAPQTQSEPRCSGDNMETLQMDVGPQHEPNFDGLYESLLEDINQYIPMKSSPTVQPEKYLGEESQTFSLPPKTKTKIMLGLEDFKEYESILTPSSVGQEQLAGQQTELHLSTEDEIMSLLLDTDEYKNVEANYTFDITPEPNPEPVNTHQDNEPSTYKFPYCSYNYLIEPLPNKLPLQTKTLPKPEQRPSKVESKYNDGDSMLSDLGFNIHKMVPKNTP
ncbi:uncharacterized protein [Procambarus clarkii]|uniref:uncharacterized protein n=1 Tax=Procambarus clarkii TaxID=6728 RepID=UPI0037444454